MSVTLWTLNRATELLDDDLFDVRAKLEGNLFSRTVHSSVGNRKPFTVPESQGNLNGKYRHQLMYDRQDYGEYFVPIELKCIGNKYGLDNAPDDDGRAILQTITQGHRHFPQASDTTKFDSFWEEGEGPLGKVRMRTNPGVGYYQILEEAAEETGPAILIGYSQGGLVARYLAFLDEYVFKKGCIAGVITVHAPSHGSSLANPANKDRVIDGLTSVFAELASVHRDWYPNVFEKKNEKVDFEDVDKVIETFFKDFDHEPKIQNRTPLQGLMATARKWLSGLRGDDDRAFYDLNVERYLDDASVLRCVHDYPLKRICHGAIIGTNDSAESILRSVAGMEGWKNFIWERIVGAKILGSTLRENLMHVTDVYQDRVVGEATDYIGMAGTDPSYQTIAEVVKRFRSVNTDNGIRGVIPARAHDFVIPSASQMLLSPPAPNAHFLGNVVNKGATHESGADPSDNAGEENVRAILRFVNDMKPHLP